MDSQSQTDSFGVELENDTNANKMSKKIFIPAIGSLGDVKPYLILADKLKQQGHIVWLGVHKRFEDTAKAAGFDTVEIGGDIEIILASTPDGIELRRNPSIFKMSLVKRVFLPVIEEWFNGIVSGLKDADLIVLSVSSILVGLSCIQKYPNIKAVGIYTFPCVRTTQFAPPGVGGKSESPFGWINLLKWKMAEYGAFSLYNDKINQLRATIELPAIRLNYYQMIQSIFHKPMITATIYSKYLLARPLDWQENDLMVGPILEDSHENFEPSTSILDFLNTWKNEKIVYVGIGSMMSLMFGIPEQIEFIHNIQLAIENNNCKAVMSLVGFQQTDANKISNTDKIFYLTQNIPHSWLFLHMSAAVHHGGAGTTHASLRYGLPTLILPFGADQPFNGDRVFINKLGPRPVPVRQTNVKNLTNAIRDLITDNYNMYEMNAKKMSESMKDEDGLGQCVRLIEAELTA